MSSATRSSGTSATITMTRRRFFVTMYLLALIAQVVVVYAIANSARAQGVSASPVQAVSSFLFTLLLFGVVAVLGVLLVRAAAWVMRIPVASESSRQQRAAFSTIRVVLALGLVVGVPVLTHGLWMKAEFLSMLPLPLFYGLVGMFIWSSTRRPKLGSGQTTMPRSATSSGWRASMDDTGPIVTEPALG